MKWKYFIAHVWHEERTTWEDIYLMPEDIAPKQALWLSVNSRIFLGQPDSKSEKLNEWTRNILSKLEHQSYVMDTEIDGEMYINLPDFNQSELLEYSKVYLNDLGFEVSELIEGSYEEFEKEISRIRETN